MPLAGQLDNPEVFSGIMLSYINSMLMAEGIDDRFEHYPEHPALLAALLMTSPLSLSFSLIWIDCTRAPTTIVLHQVGHCRQRCCV
jgi:hypothetical protein